MILPECVLVPRNLVLSLNDPANLLLEVITGRGEHRVDLVLLLADAGLKKLAAQCASNSTSSSTYSAACSRPLGAPAATA
jgi:hypothetical protein